MRATTLLARTMAIAGLSAQQGPTTGHAPAPAAISLIGTARNQPSSLR